MMGGQIPNCLKACFQSKLKTCSMLLSRKLHLVNLLLNFSLKKQMEINIPKKFLMT